MAVAMQKQIFHNMPKQPLSLLSDWGTCGEVQSQRFHDLLQGDGRSNKDMEFFVTIGPMKAFKFKKVKNVTAGSRRGVIMQSTWSKPLGEFGPDIWNESMVF